MITTPARRRIFIKSRKAKFVAASATALIVLCTGAAVASAAVPSSTPATASKRHYNHMNHCTVKPSDCSSEDRIKAKRFFQGIDSNTPVNVNKSSGTSTNKKDSVNSSAITGQRNNERYLLNSITTTPPSKNQDLANNSAITGQRNNERYLSDSSATSNSCSTCDKPVLQGSGQIIFGIR